MAQQKNTRLEKQHLDAIKDMNERDVADNESEAHRMLLNAGMKQYGYQNGGNSNTALKWLSKEFARAFAWIGVAWLALTFALPVEFRMGALFALFASLGCAGLFIVLDRHEPRVTNRLQRLLGGESA